MLAEVLARISVFSVLLTFAAYFAGVFVQKKLKLAVFNPMLIATAILIAVLMLTGVSYESYYSGAHVIGDLLTPTTVCLAVPLYKQLALLKKHAAAILTGTLCGVLTSLLGVFAFSLLFGLSHAEYVTLLPKSITTAIGMALSEEYGGFPAITTVVIALTGIFGAVTAEKICKVTKITHPIAIGVAIGTSAHAMGTSHAMEIGEVEGAMSSLALVVCGITTAVVMQVFAGLI